MVLDTLFGYCNFTFLIDRFNLLKTHVTQHNGALQNLKTNIGKIILKWCQSDQS